jgi:hypothetical protein
LRDAAARVNLGLFVLSFTFSELYRRLADHQHLLRFNISAFQLDFDVVLDLRLGLLSHVVVMEEKRGWKVTGHREAEPDTVSARGYALKTDELLLVVNKVVLLLELLSVFFNLPPMWLALSDGWVGNLLCPETHETILFLSRNFDDDAARHNRHICEDEHLALDRLSWFVVGVLRLDLNLASGECETRIPTKHCK